MLEQVKVGFVKLGNIGCAPLIELLLDERAEREDLEVHVVGSGAKMGVGEAEKVAREVLAWQPHVIVVTAPNASLPGPVACLEALSGGVPVAVVSDAASRKAIPRIEGYGFGYILVEADSMIGARKEFLDSAEMSLFNANLITVLSATGVFNIIVRELDRVLEAVKGGQKPVLPRLVVDKWAAVSAAKFSNPYARAKAMASYEVAKKAGELSFEGCFREDERERYTLLVAASHEVMHAAARLSEEARNLEKGMDTVHRSPHDWDGTLLEKRALIEKPARPRTQEEAGERRSS